MFVQKENRKPGIFDQAEGTQPQVVQRLAEGDAETTSLIPPQARGSEAGALMSHWAEGGDAPVQQKEQRQKAGIDDIAEALKDVVDPELGVNVVDLGLVYGVDVDANNVAVIDMTLTSAACPLTDVIEDQVRAALCTGPNGGLVSDFKINWVWLPPWGPDKISEDGREQLRGLGFTV